MGKAYRLPTASDRLRKNQMELKEIQALMRNRNTPRAVATTAFSGVSAAGSSGGTGNFLPLSGGPVSGQFALTPPVDFRVNIDANNTIDIGESSSNSQFASNIQIDDVTTSDILDIIKGSAHDGTFLFIRTFAPSPITIRQGNLANGGNIQTPDGNDFVLGDLQIIGLLFDESLKIEANTGGSWRVLFVSSGGGGGVSFPIDFTITFLGTIAGPIQDIDFSLSTRHGWKAELSANITLTFSNPPTGKFGLATFKFKQDVTGNHTLTLPVGTVNKDIVEAGFLLGSEEETGILIEFFNDTFYAFLETGNIVTGGSSFSGNLSDLVIDTNKDWLAQGISNVGALIGVTAVQYVDTGSVVRGSISGDAGASALRVATASGGKTIFSDVITDILEIDDTIGLRILGSHVVNMGNNIINSISELQLSNLNAHTPSNENTIAFDSIDDALKYSVALTTDSHRFYANTDLLASFSRIGTNEGLLSIQAVTATFLQATETLLLSTFNNITPTNGEVWRDSGDGKFKFRQNGITDEIGTQSAIVDGNSSATILDAAPSFVVVLDGVQKYSISNTRVDYTDLDLFGINQINMTDPTSNSISVLTASASGLNLNIISTSDVYDIQFNSIDAFHVDNLRTRILSTTPNTTPATLSIFRDDASPTIGDELGIIKYDGKNSIDAFTTYGEASVTIESLTDGAEFANYFINLKQNGFDVDMFRLVNGVMILRTFDPGPSFGANFTLLKEDASPGNGDLIGNFNWNILDSPTELTYARMQVFIQDATDAALWKIQLRSDNILQDALIIEGNDNNTQFQYLTSGNGNTRMQPLGSARMAYFVTPQVTDFSLNSGTSGSLECPRINDGSPSLSTLNGAGGAFNTSLFVHDISDGTLYVKNSNIQWDAYARTGTVT